MCVGRGSGGQSGEDKHGFGNVSTAYPGINEGVTMYVSWKKYGKSFLNIPFYSSYLKSI